MALYGVQPMGASRVESSTAAGDEAQEILECRASTARNTLGTPAAPLSHVVSDVTRPDHRHLCSAVTSHSGSQGLSDVHESPSTAEHETRAQRPTALGRGGEVLLAAESLGAAHVAEGRHQDAPEDHISGALQVDKNSNADFGILEVGAEESLMAQRPFAVGETLWNSGAGSGACPSETQVDGPLGGMRDVSGILCRGKVDYSMSFKLDGALARVLLGRQSEAKQNLEQTTGARLAFDLQSPERKTAQDPVDVVIQGPSESSVSTAMDLIRFLVKDAIETHKMDYSHFISLPLFSHQELTTKFTEFRDGLLRRVGQPDFKGMGLSIFTKPCQLHLTVQMLKLWNPYRLETASRALQNSLPALHEALGNKPLQIRVKNLELMKGSPRKAHVLYAQVLEEGGNQQRLLSACEVLRTAMREAGLVTQADQGQPLKIHLTLINTRNRKAKGRWKGPKREPLDATKVLEEHAELDWGTLQIKEAHLSQRFVFDKSGYYHCCDLIPFPQACGA